MKSRLGKLFFCLIICFFFGSSLTVVRASEDTLEINNYINDYANLIDEETESKMNQAGSTLEENTGAQVVFITVDSLEGQDIRQVAYKTFNKYGLGDENLDNGILFIVSMEEKERYMEVGTGLEGTITDIASQHLQTDYLVPQFQDGNYQKGLEDLYYQIIDAITNHHDLSSFFCFLCDKVCFIFRKYFRIIFINAYTFCDGCGSSLTVTSHHNNF